MTAQTTDHSEKWQRRFMALATHIASWTKDRLSPWGVGAVAVHPVTKQILETGYNGFPRGVNDDIDARHERPAKYLYTAHAEENLVAHAARQVLEGSTVYVTHFCCNACSRMLINAGVAKIVVGPGKTSMPDEIFVASKEMLEEAGVEVIYLQEDAEEVALDATA